MDRGEALWMKGKGDPLLMQMYEVQSRLQIARLTDGFANLTSAEKTDYLSIIVNADLTAAMIYNPEQNSETIRNLSRVMGDEPVFGSIERAIATVSEGQSLSDNNGLASSYKKWLTRRVKAAKRLCNWRSHESELEDISDHIDDLLLEGKHSKWNRALSSLLKDGNSSSFIHLLHRYLIS